MRLKNLRKAFAGLLAAACLATAKSADISGDVNAYYDTRGYPDTTVNLYGHDLPGKTDFFGFVDSSGSREKPFDLNSYGEFKLSKNLLNSFGIAIEYDRDFSASHGIARAGILFEPKIPLKDAFFNVTFYPVASHNDGTQLVLCGGKTFREGDYYIRGFCDLNFKSKGIVPFAEIQFGKRIKGNLYAVVEGRYNGFTKKDDFGIGVGLEWKFR
jgi:hypothetical protein